MQALRGSVFGIGTDIGGSVSMPASYNGIFSLKPSNGRISMKGAVGPSPGQQIMPAVPGIMGASIATIQLVLKSLLSTEPWLHDPYLVPIPWREAEEYHPESGKLGEQCHRPAFGIMENDGVVTPHPPVQRALKVVTVALNQMGYQVRALQECQGVKTQPMIHSRLTPVRMLVGSLGASFEPRGRENSRTNSPRRWLC